MATPNRQNDEIDRLRTENKRLRDELKRLELLGRKNKPEPRAGQSLGRQSGVFIFSLLAVLLLFTGNILFWTGNTIVKTDRYVDAVEPLIRQEEVQKGISSY